MMFTPRDWQANAASQCVSNKLRGANRALVCACPGAGKTLGAIWCAKQLIDRAGCGRTIIVVTPSRQIKTQWLNAAREGLGIYLETIGRASDLSQVKLGADIHGYVMTYQQMMNLAKNLRDLCEDTRAVVILDEVHHTADERDGVESSAWADAANLAFGRAEFVLATTGTPFREGPNPIAFVDYDDSGEVCSAFKYTYGDAIRDRVCRPIRFEPWDGRVAFMRRGKTVECKSFFEPLSKRDARYRLQAAIDAEHESARAMLESGHRHLMAIRAQGGLAARSGGLVVARRIEHAEALKRILADVSGTEPVLVHGSIEDDKPQAVIDRFRHSDDPWIIGVSMLSEGVDIQRLRVGVYLSDKTSALYFHQFCGRVMRVQERDRDERAVVVMPQDPILDAVAATIERDVTYALGDVRSESKRSIGNREGSNRRNALTVLSSKLQQNGIVLRGYYFSPAYMVEHKSKIDNYRSKDPGRAHKSDEELALDMADAGGLAYPGAQSEAVG